MKYDVTIELPNRIPTIEIEATNAQDARERTVRLMREIGWVLPNEVRILTVTPLEKP